MQNLQKPATEFVEQISQMSLPEGNTKKRLSKIKNPYIQVLLGPAEFLGKNHCPEDDTLIDILTEHLQIESGLPHLLDKVSKGTSKVSEKRRLLERLNYRAENLFVLIERALERTVQEKETQLRQGPPGTSRGEIKEPSFDDILPLKNTVEPTDFDNLLSREAEETNVLHPVFKDKQEPKISASSDSQFERIERAKDFMRQRRLEANLKEAKTYLELAQTVREVYDKTLGVEIQQGSSTER